MDFQYVDEVERVNDRECFLMTRRLAREEGLFVGGSCGAAVAGALKYLRRHDRPDLTAVVLLPDSGSRYLSKIYNDQWMADNGFAEDPLGLGTVADLLATLDGDRDPITVGPEVTVSQAIGLLKLHGISAMPVVAEGRVLGVIHESRLLEAALRGTRSDGRCGELADTSYCSVSLDTEVAVLSDLMRRVRLALVFDGDNLRSVLSRIDIIDHVARRTAAS